MSRKRYEREEREEASMMSVSEDPITAKIRVIKDSNMPEEQKNDYIMSLLPKGKSKLVGIPFSVYAKMKNIPKTLHKAMQAYPKAKNVSLATLENWEEIFKDF